MVAMVVHELPVMTLTMADMMQVEAKKYIGVYNLYAIIDERRHHTTHHPCAAEGANK